uniref:Uncharacterized protein n=1 Tax=Candidatus Kentrum sp. UNK TaxID=2126344 RepID=A0A451B3C6_9GAMM|nr:MAG: hypothetical protein BECKUNK1418G_GA0071005_11412 [Candidatus Kentron sp. UNK]VFK72773.1 MAG: hypothetical protein BECKUNK1418H_GA0071006_11382 [Candidatus Kentron sp. UNK]
MCRMIGSIRTLKQHLFTLESNPCAYRPERSGVGVVVFGGMDFTTVKVIARSLAKTGLSRLPFLVFATRIAILPVRACRGA